MTYSKHVLAWTSTLFSCNMDEVTGNVDDTFSHADELIKKRKFSFENALWDQEEGNSNETSILYISSSETSLTESGSSTGIDEISLERSADKSSAQEDIQDRDGVQEQREDDNKSRKELEEEREGIESDIPSTQKSPQQYTHEVFNDSGEQVQAANQSDETSSHRATDLDTVAKTDWRQIEADIKTNQTSSSRLFHEDIKEVSVEVRDEQNSDREEDSEREETEDYENEVVNHRVTDMYFENRPKKNPTSVKAGQRLYDQALERFKRLEAISADNKHESPSHKKNPTTSNSSLRYLRLYEDALKRYHRSSKTTEVERDNSHSSAAKSHTDNYRCIRLYNQSKGRQVEGRKRRTEIQEALKKAKELPEHRAEKISLKDADRLYYQGIKHILDLDHRRLEAAEVLEKQHQPYHFRKEVKARVGHIL